MKKTIVMALACTFLYGCAGRGSYTKDTVVLVKHDTIYQNNKEQQIQDNIVKHAPRADENLPDTGTVLGDLKLYNLKFLPHLLDNGVTITGSILNKSESTDYKDVIIRAYYFTKTETLIRTEDFTIYEYFGPGSLVGFKVKGANLDDVGNITVVIVNGTPTTQ